MREEREPRGATVEGWRRVESYIFLETAREKSRPLRGSCPRGHLSRAKESEPKRKRRNEATNQKKLDKEGRKKERKKERKGYGNGGREYPRGRRMQRVCERAASGPSAARVVRVL